MGNEDSSAFSLTINIQQDACQNLILINAKVDFFAADSHCDRQMH